MPIRYVSNEDVQIAIYQWGDDQADLPQLLLAHGTGFGGPIWMNVAQSLSSHFNVYAFDRRGHGLSSKPEDAYHFQDFTEDLITIIDCLELQHAYGVGHSAGATDLLLAAPQSPKAFRRIFAMEPTTMDPMQYQLNEPLQHAYSQANANMQRRREVFPSHEEVLDRYRTRPAFLAWEPELLEIYVRYGFEKCSDGSVKLLCTPFIESRMNQHITAAMGSYYTGDHRGNPFEALNKIECRTCIASAEYSGNVYKGMARTALRLIPNAEPLYFKGVGHCVAQEKPDEVVAALLDFWRKSE